MKKVSTIIMALTISCVAISQQFEEPKFTGDTTKNVKVKVGADFALQFQSLTHHADDTTLIPLGSGINLPTANFNIDAQLARGIKVNLVTYLSSRHHTDAWVKGGYLLVDRMPFNCSSVDKIMNYLTLKVGVMELDYGDAHFRRSDNGNAINNPFVGNYIMDAFTTAAAIEVLFRYNGLLILGGVTNGNLNPSIAGYSAIGDSIIYKKYNVIDELAYYTKIGFDKQLTSDFRIRTTVSGYFCENNHSGSLYNGDRTGSRYYLVMKPETGSSSDVDPSVNHLSGNWGPGATDRDNSVMANIFAKYKGIEFFGTYENIASSTNKGLSQNYWQYALEGIYRFGKKEQFYGGLRYNYIENNLSSSINRIQVAAGWKLTENIITKIEYVNQMNNKVSYYGKNAGFKGLMVEAALSF